MKAFPGVLAVLLMLSCASFAQTAQPPAGSTPSTDAAGAGTGAAPVVPADPAVPAVIAVPPAPAAIPLFPGARVFLEPMNGFEKLLADAIHDKKVPVVLVKERAEADFFMSGEAHVKSPNILTGMILTKRGGANIAMKDARTDKLVFACNFHRVDDGERPGDIYIGWAGQCAGHLKKALKEEEKRKASSSPH